ncbi:hypothetical protein GCM10009544_66770 [Streptomyces stramineus]|uniref:Uncharacterized protein n=1 Tax=Streptomyces stramineus TaxID=173861 RepID=A0ABP3LFL7_9ACTN
MAGGTSGARGTTKGMVTAAWTSTVIRASTAKGPAERNLRKPAFRGRSGSVAACLREARTGLLVLSIR